MFELSHSKSKKLTPSKKLRSLTSLQDISRNFHLGSFLKCRFFREETTIQPPFNQGQDPKQRVWWHLVAKLFFLSTFSSSESWLSEMERLLRYSWMALLKLIKSLKMDEIYTKFTSQKLPNFFHNRKGLPSYHHPSKVAKNGFFFSEVFLCVFF